MELIPANSPHRQSAHAGTLAVQQPRAFNSTLNMCDSLISFYHQERMWVYRTRASLELVLEAAPTDSSDTSVSHTAEPEAAPESKGSGSAMVLRSRRASGVKQEPVDPPNLSSTLWMRRKKSFKLKLEGISTRATKRRRQSPRGRDASCDQEEPPTPSVQILELFENMMQSRMESCERLSKMVKEAHAAHPNLEGVEI
ncbi:hypothetical protein FIBSPDRAFT_865170 [Athelia psychrophila]|uniref:Uncharacterized protein n=1 Tax=Athelia psychrophila TaxID=1759441 RepID=A0A166FYM3_9AGAM|nr:hypothetical protein FIBSPDRAFT_865170 [Fibularhizoctonia sp. CBS 109695]